MRIGPKKLRLVSIDSAGVPTGGKYGSVRWFARTAVQSGIKLAWSRMWGRFVLYTQPRRRFICLMVCHNWSTQAPIALTAPLLWVLRHLKKRHGATSAAGIQSWMKQQERDSRSDYQNEVLTEEDDMRAETIRAIRRKLDPGSRPLISIPRVMRPHGVNIGMN